MHRDSILPIIGAVSYTHLSYIGYQTQEVKVGDRVSLSVTLAENQQILEMCIRDSYICALYQREDGILYIGTRGAGLLVYDINKKKFGHQYRTDNCALISDNIYTILPRQDESLLMGTETGITIYSQMCIRDRV